MEPTTFLQFDIPDLVAEQMFRIPNLDNIGPARWAEDDRLDLINATNSGIIELSTIPLS